MSTPRSGRRTPKRWVEDHEVSKCPLCSNRFEGNFLDITLSGRTHCRYCGGVFCTSCCKEELYMPEDEVVRPPRSAKFKSMVFDPTVKQKACRLCVKVLLPQQEAIKAARRGGGRPNGFVPRKSPRPLREPYYTIVVVRARSLRGSTVNVMNPVCLITVGNTSCLTEATQNGSNPVWEQSFDFGVTSELGNHMKLTCYEDDRMTKISIGEGSTKVVETGQAGAWVPITDDRKAVTGEVLLRVTYKGPRTPRPTHVPARGVPVLPGYEVEGEEDTESTVPVLHWLQDKAWVVYVVLLMLSVLYRFANSRGFTGDPITLRPGVPTSNNISKRSETHYITLHKDGNLILREGKPGDPVRNDPVWESGRAFDKKDCPKCVFLVDESGKKLMLKNGRKVLKSFDLSEDKVLSAAIKTR